MSITIVITTIHIFHWVVVTFGVNDGQACGRPMDRWRNEWTEDSTDEARERLDRQTSLQIVSIVVVLVLVDDGRRPLRVGARLEVSCVYISCELVCRWSRPPCISFTNPSETFHSWLAFALFRLAPLYLVTHVDIALFHLFGLKEQE